MKNNLWIFLISVVFTLSSCITAAQFNNAEDDVYYSPKAGNQKQPVMIPEVDVDEIIKNNPPQYGNPTNRIDDGDTYTNPMAAQYYPYYKAYQDSIAQQNPRYSAGYVNPDFATDDETQEAVRLRRLYGNGNNNSGWNVGLGWNWWGPSVSFGYNNGYYGYNNGYYGYNNCCGPFGGGYGYNSFYHYNPWYNGFGYGGFYGYNNWYSPWYGGFGYYSPWYGGGYYNPWYGGYYNGYYPGDRWNNGGGSGSNAGNQSISRPRQGVGNTTPPDNGGRNAVNPTPNANNPGGRYVAPSNQGQAQPNQPATQSVGRTSTYTPTQPEQKLENVNGRPVYTRPAEPARPAQTAPAAQPSNRNSGSSGRTRNNATQGTGTTQPNYNNNNNYSTPQLSPPANGGRSSGSGSGGRGSSGGGGGSSSGGNSGGGRRR